MLLTETEARDRWCPHARVPDASADDSAIVGVNRLHTTDDRCNLVMPASTDCLGSGCMAWRWGEWALTDVHTTTGDSRPMVVQVEDRARPTRGYCGLAGRP